jgi:hypothetical protein
MIRTSLNLKIFKNLGKNIFPLVRRTFVDDKSTNQNSSDDQKIQEKKGTKHIYKQKTDENYDDDVEIIRDEATITYSEGFDNDGVYVRQRSSFVYYEVGPKGSTSQSGGKSGKDQNKTKTDDKSEKEQDKTTKDGKQDEKLNENKAQKEHQKKDDTEMPEGNKKI